MVIFAQGIPFLHGGQEFFRTKFGVENSYQHPDEINAVNWDDVKRHQSETHLVKGYLQIRKAHGAFRFQKSSLVKKHVEFSNYEESVIGYSLRNVEAYGPYAEIHVFFNLKDHPCVISESFEGFHVIADADASGLTPLRQLADEFVLAPLSTTIIAK